jgi:hypothetical protein
MMKMKENTSPYYELAREFVLKTNSNIFLTGKAGTGKTTFLHQLKKLTGKQMAVVAPTGIAAINAGGTTMHSFFQLPFTPFIPTSEGKKHLLEKIRIRANRRKILQELELLVIDEISMVRADTLDAMDAILRSIRFKHKEPFGGVQVIFIGDMFQLSPVLTEDDKQVLKDYYPSPYFFHSRVMLDQKPVYIELDTIFRQSNEQFIRILNEVRNNCLQSDSLKILQSRHMPDFVPEANDGYITLTTHNYKADLINAQELEKIDGETRCYSAKTEGEFYEKSYPTEMELCFKVGAKVMIIKNDTEIPRRFYNGKIGIITKLEKEVITLKCPDDEKELDITPMEWENIQYSSDPRTMKISEEVVGKFIQFPLRLAWAITIHKSQGLTFQKAVIDAGEAFAPGQVYVALSRCTSLEGMVLKSRINPFSIENDWNIVEFEKQKPNDSTLRDLLDDSKKRFREHTLGLIFEYQTLIYQTNRIQKLVEEANGSYGEEVIPFLQEMVTLLTEMKELSQKFMLQLSRIILDNPVDEQYLQNRLQAAAQYFIEKNNALIKHIIKSPASTDSHDNARDYNQLLKNVYDLICLRNYLLKNIKHPFEPTSYFELKSAFVASDFTVNAWSKVSSGKSFKVAHPALYKKLVELRNKICEKGGDIPVYMVAANKSLQEMADYLPTSERDLMEIHGFGKTKVVKYGKDFLSVILDYCLENNLTSTIYEKSAEAGAGKKKRKKQ